MTVSYVEPSMDAAIAGDYKDLKFENNQQTPIYIELVTDGTRITANVYGKETRPANRQVDFVSEIVEEVEPEVVYKAAPDQPIGYINRVQSANTGYEAHLLKIVTVDGVEESNQIFNRSSYKARNKIIAVGTMSDSPDATAAVQSAISTQDDNVIRVTVAERTGALEPREEETSEIVTVNENGVATQQVVVAE